VTFLALLRPAGYNTAAGMTIAEERSNVATGYALGKVILFGEHAVVYSRPAIAVPLAQVRAEATVTPASPGAGITLLAHDLGRAYKLSEATADDPLRAITEGTLRYFGLSTVPDLTVSLRSTIPVARGLGSGAAVSTAIVRALAAHFRHPLTPDQVSQLVYEVEKLHHGTPSGIDNTVIAFEQPVYFVRGQPPEHFSVRAPFTLAIADSGVQVPTRVTVGDVRRAWQADPQRYETIFDEIGEIARAGRRAIEGGDVEAVGRLMDDNQRLLQALDVSSPGLDALVTAARAAGALGAKLSGGGRGGNVIALVAPGSAAAVERALLAAGAVGVIVTEVAAS
jgi:mevalonate kinase